ncbi:hypothetical protein L873DRAFT_1805260 [Choiromyces venosus 120613-1]|uniref:Uncharacterized protein n=1 Tax=Choiromyces venosus 120613-1 TaxID=1336337 RepID=A0A3N4JW80_9PEZI|nr:hypothetical protein L873DRAFT_1805260 [Choiromyces venosus 120613-1]
MLVPHMSDEIIVSFDPLVTHMLASGNRTVMTFDKMFRLIVSVEGLLRLERRWPSAIRLVTSEGAAGASMPSTFPS